MQKIWFKKYNFFLYRQLYMENLNQVIVSEKSKRKPRKYVCKIKIKS